MPHDPRLKALQDAVINAHSRTSDLLRAGEITEAERDATIETARKALLEYQAAEERL